MFGGFGLLLVVFGGVWGCLESLWLASPLLTIPSAVGLISKMFSTEQQSSSRRKDKAPAERLTPLQEKESENAGLRRQVYDFQLEIDELRARKQDLEADQVAKNVVIERLSNDLSRWELDNAELQKRNYWLQAFLHDLFEKRYQELQAYQDRYRALKDEYQSDLVDAQKLMNNESDPVPLAASKTAETKERVNPQFKQSGLHRHAEELESQKTSKDTTEGWFKKVEVKKDKLADGSSSKAPVLAGSFSNKNYFGLLDQEDPWKKIKLPRTAKVSNQNIADKMYVAPSPDQVKSDEQSRASSTWPWSVPSSTPEASVSIPPNTSILGSGDRHGFERSWASPLKAESVNDYAQKAATSAQPNSSETPDFFEILMAKHQKRYGVNVDVEKELAKIKQRHAAESSEPGQDQMRGVDSSSKSKSRQLKATTHGDNVMQSADEDMLNEGGPRLATEVEEDEGVEATRESKQPGVESTKAKRSFSQSFSEPELSQKKTKTDEN